MKVLQIDIGKSYGGVESVVKYFISTSVKDLINYVCVKKNTKFFDELEKMNYDKLLSYDFSSKFPRKDFKNITKFCIKNGIEIINMHGVGASLLPVFYKKNKNIKYVYTVHGDTDIDRMNRSRFERFLYRFLEKRAMKKCDIVVAVSNDIKEKLIKRGISPNKITVIYNGTNVQKDKLDLKVKKRTKFLTIGRLDSVKNYSELIKAFSMLNDEYTLDIIGMGEEYDNLKNEIEKYNLNSRVKLLGFVDDAKNIIKNYDFYIQPSLYETFGICILEAMANSVPVICSNVGGMREIVTDQINGFLIQGFDALNIKKAIIYSSTSNVIDDVIRNGYLTIDKFSSQAMIDEYYKLYKGME